MEKPFHCPLGSQPCVYLDKVWITQDYFDGMCQLINWLDGFEAAGKGRVPGHHELIMFYRGLTTAARKSPQPEEQPKIE